jgi:hypothetical protein
MHRIAAGEMTPMAYLDTSDLTILDPSDGDVPVDLGLAFESETYSLTLRIAVILGLSGALWAVIFAGGWGLYRLIA